MEVYCRNPSFGLATKAKGSQGGGPRESPRVTSHTLGSVGKCPKTSNSDFRGQKSMACSVLYIIGKLLERRCLKWARIAHLDIWNTSYGQKKGQESNCQFNSRPEKSRIDPIYSSIDSVRHTVGKLSMRATTLLQTESRSEVCSQSYGASKSRESQLGQFRDSHLGVPG
jgi:hypothetical protein